MDIEPTFKGYIEDEKDALLIIQATMDGKLKHIPRRPYEIERSYLIASGNIFVFIEEISGIKRWTDGVTWSPSRIAGKFLIYKEIDKSIVINKNKLKHLPKKCEYINNKNRSPKNKKSLIQVHDVNDQKISTKPRIKLPPLLNNKNGSSKNKDRDNKSSYGSTNFNEMKGNLNYSEFASNQSTSDFNEDSSGEIDIGNPKNNSPYSEISKKIPLKSLHPTKYTGLIKKTISVSLRRGHSKQQETFHIISYYTIDDVKENRLITPKDSLVFRNIKLNRELIKAVENIKLGNPKIITKEKKISKTPENTYGNNLENTLNTGTYQSSQYIPNPYSDVPIIGGASNINQSNSSSQNVNNNNNDNVNVNFVNNTREDSHNSQNSSTINNIIPVVGSFFVGNNNNKFNPNNNMSLNNDAAGFPSSVPVQQGPYYTNQPQPFSNNMVYMNAENGDSQNSMFNGADVNSNFSTASLSQVNQHQNHHNTYGHYYQGTTNMNGGYSTGDANINNGMPSQNQIIQSVASGLPSSSDAGYSNVNSFQGTGTSSNNLNNIMPAIRTNATYTLYPVTISPGTNNQMPSIANNNNNNNTVVTDNSMGNPTINYLNNSVSYPISSTNQPFMTSNNTSRVAEPSFGNMIPTPVSLQNKNFTNNPSALSYVGKYNNGSVTNYYKAPEANQQINISPDLNNVRIRDINNNNFNTPTQYSSNIYTYPGAHHSTN